MRKNQEKIVKKTTRAHARNLYLSLDKQHYLMGRVSLLSGAALGIMTMIFLIARYYGVITFYISAEWALLFLLLFACVQFFLIKRASFLKKRMNELESEHGQLVFHKDLRINGKLYWSRNRY